MIAKKNTRLPVLKYGQEEEYTCRKRPESIRGEINSEIAEIAPSPVG
jgi:hypothetical protein